MDEKFIEAVQKLEQATQMQWDEFDWLDNGHSVFAVYDCDQETSDGLMFTIAGNHSPAWAERLNCCGLDEVAKVARLYGAISLDDFVSIMNYYNNS